MNALADLIDWDNVSFHLINICCWTGDVLGRGPVALDLVGMLVCMTVRLSSCND